MKATFLPSTWPVLLLACAVAAAALVFSGCGGGGSRRTTQRAASWTQVGATYVGRARCRDCHATIDDAYATQDMGDNAPTRMSGENCGTCHATGYLEAGGFKFDGTTPHLDGIGCEVCHGPGSKHVQSLEKQDITRVPPAEKACYPCHSDRPYKSLDMPTEVVTAETLAEEPPSRVGPHYSPTRFLLGQLRYEAPTADAMPSPHSTLPNTCLNCHFSPTRLGANGKVDHGVDASTPNLNTARAECASCHSGRAGDEQPVQAGINAMLIKLGGEDPANPGQFDSSARGGLLGAFATEHAITVGSNTTPTDPFVIQYKAARYAFNYVVKDHSLGVHNPAFANKLLEDAVAKLAE